MNTGFSLEQGAFGACVVATGAWTAKIAEYMSKHMVRELYLNHARGWVGDNVDFLRDLPELDAFRILDFTIKDVSAIHALGSLRLLEVSTYCTTPVDFARFPRLEDCAIYWRDGSTSLFACEKLERLFLHRYSGVQSASIAQLERLVSLSIANGGLQEVRHLGNLKRLRRLGLYNLAGLTSLRGIGRLTQLEELEVNGCRAVDQIEELATLEDLRKLQLNDDGAIASLAPLRTATGLEELLFYESTNVRDGDLAVLTQLPRLKRVWFQNRRHYTHTRESLRVLGSSMESIRAEHE